MKRKTATPQSREQVLDQYFMDARCKLIDVAAFLDRVERTKGKDDFRLKAFRAAVEALRGRKTGRAKRVLLTFSDPTTRPVPVAPGKGACGAWPGKA